jgi:hypothetical protein
MPLHKPLLQFSRNKIRALRAITGEKVSETKEEFVAPAELHRVYPVATIATDAMVAELYKVIDDLRADRDAWREQAQRIALRAPQRRWWWSRASGA